MEVYHLWVTVRLYSTVQIYTPLPLYGYTRSLIYLLWYISDGES